jgi:hypothetical protein
MYNWVHKCLKEAIMNMCGEAKWTEIYVKADIGEDKLSTSDNTT